LERRVDRKVVISMLHTVPSRGFVVSVFAVCLTVEMFAGCSGTPEGEDNAKGDAKPGVLRLATTTSTRDSGLLDVLLPPFEEAHNCRVDVIAVGTGAALRLGETGEVDVVMVHARKAEEAFMAAKHGIRHEEFMYNSFVILGPPDDPAEIRDADPIESLKKIAAAECVFVSRGDDSGTHKRESSLWEQAGGRPEWADYFETGQGMGPTLIIADEKRGYVLADTGTYLNFQGKIDLVPLAAAADSLRNPYAVIVVNPSKDDKIRSELADEFVGYLLFEKAQRLIANYKVADQRLFTPTRLRGDE
jgi:tungstate transport system substrate-binding protein